ncbi:hypothetical protein UlMin_034756 [Ulmus minor]
MDFDEHDDPDEDMEIPTAPPGYDSSLPNSTAAASGRTQIGGEGASATARKSSNSGVRYRECLKNHAVGIGGHAVDGCCEFMAAGEEGTLDALKCAACNCHRNFHRKESEGDHQNSFPQLHHHGNPFSSSYYRSPSQPSGYLHLTPQAHHRPLALPGGGGGGGGGHSREEGEDVSNPSSSGGGGSGLKKRFRTKFSQEQKEKMLDFAERLGWRIQKHDEAAVEHFCSETGVRRQVLKVWMHNNKHTLGKKP